MNLPGLGSNETRRVTERRHISIVWKRDVLRPAGWFRFRARGSSVRTSEHLLDSCLTRLNDVSTLRSLTEAPTMTSRLQRREPYVTAISSTNWTAPFIAFLCGRSAEIAATGA